jgi:hypothetical protein
LNLPKSLKWARVRLTPDDRGGGALDVEMEDENDDLAEKHAREIERMLMAPDLRLWALGFPESRVVSSAVLKSDGAMIRGTLFLSPEHVSTVIHLGETFMAAPSQRGVPQGAPSTQPSGSFAPAPR